MGLNTCVSLPQQTGEKTEEAEMRRPESAHAARPVGASRLSLTCFTRRPDTITGRSPDVQGWFGEHTVYEKKG
jgi:hypothetical protein